MLGNRGRSRSRPRGLLSLGPRPAAPRPPCLFSRQGAARRQDRSGLADAAAQGLHHPAQGGGPHGKQAPLCAQASRGQALNSSVMITDVHDRDLLVTVCCVVVIKAPSSSPVPLLV